MARRYKTGEYEFYDLKFVALRNSSQVLSRVDTPSVYTILFDKKNLEGYKASLVGNKDGEYFRNGERVTAEIPALKRALKEVEALFEAYCDEQDNMGYDQLEIEPKEMLEKRLSLEARLDIALEELAKIEERLKSYLEEEKTESTNRVLQYGLICSAQLTDSIITEIDGQIVERTKDDKAILIIKDKRSPYNGMSLNNYRKLSKIWIEERKIADEEELKRIQQLARERGLPVPSGYSSIYSQYVPKELLPVWPDWAIDHLKTELQRTK